MLITIFFLLFVACIVYMRTDMSISKNSASYLAKLQWDEVTDILRFQKDALRLMAYRAVLYMPVIIIFFGLI